VNAVNVEVTDYVLLNTLFYFVSSILPHLREVQFFFFIMCRRAASFACSAQYIF
jgi:hypothetical protein